MGDVYRVILYKVTEALHFPVGDSEVYGSGSMSDIVWFVRLPRLVLAIGVGMALALSLIHICGGSGLRPQGGLHPEPDGAAHPHRS